MSEQSEQDIATVAIAVEWYDTERTNFALERLVTHIQELEQQRSAALKLAEKWASRADKELGGEVHGEPEIRIDEDACCADELHAIFTPKEQA